ncbi:hypothetical protein [Actinomadura roseirufa]|nr:hypothetical protein [Actinomadura roseirufa]
MRHCISPSRAGIGAIGQDRGTIALIIAPSTLPILKNRPDDPDDMETGHA